MNRPLLYGPGGEAISAAPENHLWNSARFQVNGDSLQDDVERIDQSDQTETVELLQRARTWLVERYGKHGPKLCLTEGRAGTLHPSKCKCGDCDTPEQLEELRFAELLNEEQWAALDHYVGLESIEDIPVFLAYVRLKGLKW